MESKKYTYSRSTRPEQISVLREEAASLAIHQRDGEGYAAPVLDVDWLKAVLCDSLSRADLRIAERAIRRAWGKK